VLSVSRDGFAPFELTLQDVLSPLTIRLSLPEFAQQLTVEGTTRVGSVSLSAEGVDLRSLAASTTDLIRYVQQLSGNSARAPAVYVDGLPATTLPPLDLIAEISIDGDPFSVEYGDGIGVAVEIVTRTPGRAFRMFSGVDLPAIGGRNILSESVGETARSLSIGTMGAVPGVPVTFFATTNVLRSSHDIPMLVQMPEFRGPSDTAEASTGVTAGSLGLFFSPRESFRARLSIRESRARMSNSGVGGITREEAGSSQAFIAREIRTTATAFARRVRIESGAVINYTSTGTRANSAEPGIAIGGDVVMGGASLLEGNRRSLRWTMKHVVRPASSRRWLFGVIAGRSDESHTRTPNPLGSFYFSDVDAYRAAQAGEPTGIWQVDRGGSTAGATISSVSPFAQFEVARSRRYAVTAGIRADYRSTLGMVASPRLSGSASWERTLVRTGVGVFARSVPEATLLAIAERGGNGLMPFITTHASLADFSEFVGTEASPMRSRLGGDTRQPRGVVWRTSVERSIAGVTAAVEYEVAADSRLMGSNRIRTASGVEDLVESNRGSLRHHVRVHAMREWRGQRLMADYDFTRARDNTDGAFSFPERSGDVASEWARSAGVPRHEISVMAALMLPGGVSMNVSDVWRGSAPFNVTTGIDAEGLGLAVDRGGRARNSGDGPSFHSLSLYAQRRVPLPRIVKAADGHGLSVAIQVSNLLNGRNYISLGSVVGSDTFGVPLSAYPARSIRILINVD
jgi:hypothetical protein